MKEEHAACIAKPTLFQAHWTQDKPTRPQRGTPYFPFRNFNQKCQPGHPREQARCYRRVYQYARSVRSWRE